MRSLQNALLFQAELMAFGLAKVCHPSFALAGLKWLFFREQINHSSTSAGMYTEEWTQTALPIRIKENANNTMSHYKKKKKHNKKKNRVMPHNSSTSTTTWCLLITFRVFSFQGIQKQEWGGNPIILVLSGLRFINKLCVND